MTIPSPTNARAGAHRRTLALTPRDRSVLEPFRAIRFAETSHLAGTFVPDLFPSAHKLRLRLGRLAATGYLTRPARRIAPARVDAYAVLADARPRGRPEDVWALADKGARLLDLRGDWNRNNSRLRSTSFAHPLMVTRVYVTLLAAARRGLASVDRWIGESQWKTTVMVAGEPLPLVPDGTCLLADPRGNREVPFFLEVDNETAPLARKNFRQSSFRRKCVAYWHYWHDEIRPHSDPLVVLTVAKTAARAEALRATAEATDDHGRGLNLFWFTSEDRWTIDAPEEFLNTPIWTTAAGERRALLRS